MDLKIKIIKKPQRILVFSVLVIFLIVSLVFASEYKPFEKKPSENASAKISGIVYDTDSGKGIINELAICLLDTKDMGSSLIVYWPKDPSNPGYYEFVNLSAGQYLLYVTRSWEKHHLTDSSVGSIEGGWNLPSDIIIDLGPNEHYIEDFYLDFYAHKTYQCEFDGDRFRYDTATPLSYGDKSIFMDDSNLLGKQMTLSVTWNNTIPTRTDFDINIMDMYYSNVSNYDAGECYEFVSLTIDEEFLHMELSEERFFWKITALQAASFDTSSVPFCVRWIIE